MLDKLRNEKRPPYTARIFSADLKAGITLTASFVPTTMALGVISGLGPLAGLWCGVLVGIVAAVCGGTRALVSGPSAVLAVIAATLVAGDRFSLSEIAVIVVMAGAMQIGLGLAGLGRFVSYMPHIVLAGFMSGIGVLLLWKQAYKLFHLGMADLAIAGGGLVLMAVWPARAGRLLPSALAVVALGWLATRVLPGAERLGPVPVGLPDLALELPSLAFLPEAIGPAALVALISSVYSLMWALIADTFTNSQHNPNRELVAQGLGNLAAGAAGVLPGGATIATMSARRFGGKTVFAGIVCLLIVAALILSLGPHVAPLPVAALTAIVMLVGWKMIDFSFLRKVRRMDAKYSSVMLLTMGATVFVDPFFAIVLGVIAANIVNATQIESLELDSVVSVPILDSAFDPSAGPFEAHVGLLAFRGPFTVSSSRKLIRQAGDDIRDHEAVIFDFSGTTHIDDSAANVIAVLIDRAKQTGTEVVVCGDTSRIARPLYAFGVLDRIPKDRIVETEEEARTLAWSLVKRG